MLLGREAEQAMLRAALSRARAGQSGVLVLQGEPGVGKTALLDYAQSLADDYRVFRVAGIEQETEIAFAGLFTLLHPLVGQIDALPPRQRSALRSALGYSSSPDLPGPDWLAIASGTLGLLSAAAEQQPLLVLVDDLHWMDASTAEALLFAIRRLDSDPIATVLATRPGVTGLTGLTVHDIAGLGPAEASQLVRAVAGEAPSPAVARLLHAETGGNPLALKQLADTLTPGQLAGIGLPVPDLPLVSGAAVLGSYAARLARLPSAVRLTLLIAAAAGRCSSSVVLAAAAEVGGSPKVEEAEDAGVVSVGAAGIEFAHPLLRSAAYHDAPRSQQRTAHRVLATMLAESDPERAAWHMAAAATGTDDRAARALDAAARAAEHKGASLLAADAWERASELSRPGSERNERLALAAEAALRAGELGRASRLGDLGRDDTLEPQLAARLLAVRGQAELLGGSVVAAHRSLVGAAALAESRDVSLAVELLARACIAAIEAGLDEAADRSRARMMRMAAQADEDARFLAALAHSSLVWNGGDPAKAMEIIGSCADTLAGSPALAANPERHLDISNGWAGLGQLRKASQHADAALELARDLGAHGLLARTLDAAAWCDSQIGRWQRSLARATQALDLAHAGDQRLLACNVLLVLTEIEAAQGREQECREHAREADALASELALPLIQVTIRRHRASLDLAVGRIAEAVARYEQVYAQAVELGIRHPYYSPLFDLIESLARAGNVDRARELMPDITAQVPGIQNPAPGGRLARLCGILAEDDYDAHFTQAIELHEGILVFQQARSRLSYGERLRRSQRRREARAQLRAAIETFDRLDARPWAERAQTELRATGETLTDRSIVPEQLTPQELQVALLVADGKTNAEAGRALFLSTRTVEVHLYRAYRKMGVASRTELTRLMTATDLIKS